jgi:uncharacterized repeat protein (TIGR03803 family)
MKIKSLITLLALIMVAMTSVFAAAEDPEVILHNFSGGGADQPGAGLIADANGNLYGVTGVYGVGCGAICGTVFELSPSSGGWTFSTLYGFKGGVDGSAPSAPLTLGPDGSLYGTTATGGGTCHLQQGGCGTVFKLTPGSNGKWTETVLHRFNNTADGGLLFSSVVFDASGNLYGTTNFAGLVSPACPQGCGTIFEMSPNGDSWTFTVIHSFTGGADGKFGGSLAFNAKGNLFGTSGGGIVNNICAGDGCGNIFKIVPNGSGWTLTVIYNFSGKGDGLGALSLVFDPQGDLYGAALYGGYGTSGPCWPNGCGTVFKLAPNGDNWNFSVLHSFIGSDGANPSGIVLDAAGDIYGATEFDGPSGYGTIFRLAQAGGDWTMTLLFSFDGGDDGNYPSGPPVPDAAGNLYGVTGNGGTAGAGVAFELIQ